MALDDLKDFTDDHEDDEGGSSGQGGHIEFKDFIGTEKLRDDLAPAEINRLQDVHQRFHESNVKKQKALSDERKALKEGKVSLEKYRADKAANSLQGGNSGYKANPVLAKAAQFSGVDRQVNALPSEHLAETNQDKAQELKYQNQLRNTPQNAPKFNPKPQFRGG